MQSKLEHVGAKLLLVKTEMLRLGSSKLFVKEILGDYRMG